MIDENEIIDDLEQNESELSRSETQEGLGENEQAHDEGNTETEQGDNEVLEEATEGIAEEYPVYDDTQVLEYLGIIDGRLEALETSQSVENETLFEKELDNYTTTEGLLLIIVLFLTASFIMERIGNIIRCEKE